MFSRESSKLFSLLGDSPFEPGILALADACEKILRDNQLPFFPAYTDHGSAHVHLVLEAAERLIPDSVWESQALEPADAAVLIGATYLHDLGMHLREDGFSALVSTSSPFKPLPWFDRDQDGRPADVEWPVLWEDFRREARHLTKSQLDRILGPANKPPQIAMADPEPPKSEWIESDRLLIGEFIRRHHARLSHEIAVRGFPGASKTFPVLMDTVPQLADAIGVTARSHNLDLRQAREYLEYREPGNKRPDGAVQLYLMAVLRIADYFQVGAERAPPLLMHLRQPQSPLSVEEWHKNQAISSISWENDDPFAVYIQVSPAHSLRTHLQMRELIDDLQKELDVSTAVLGESFGPADLGPLVLSRQRVRTNLDLPSLHERLSFVPRKARLRSDEDLFRLVISDLYGNQPAVAGRELLQNAIDAVRERLKWQDEHETEIDEAQLRDLPADVLVEIVEVDEESSYLRIADRGIGMTPTTVIDIFLSAGASFGDPRSDEEGLDSARAIKWMKTGRFGVGVFAAFLLGSEVRVTTRHAGEARGISFTASLDHDLVQLDWVDDAPVGTEITVPYSPQTLPPLNHLERPGEENSAIRQAEARNNTLLEQTAGFYELVKPTVVYRRVLTDKGVVTLQSTREVPIPKRPLPKNWRSFEAPGFDALLWRVPPGRLGGLRFSLPISREGKVTHNGIVIRKPNRARNTAYSWSRRESIGVVPPAVAVFDTQQSLGIALNRYELTDPTLPFERELLKSIGLDVVAHSLVKGEARHPLASGWGLSPVAGREKWLPLLPGLTERYVERELFVLWYDNPRHEQLRMFSQRFLSPRDSKASWRDLPLRMSLIPEPSISDPRDEAERDYWGIAYSHVVSSTRRLGSSLGMTPVAGTFIQWPGQGRGIRHHPPPETVLEPRWRQGRIASRPIPLEEGDESRVPELNEIGIQILEGNGPCAIGLAVLQPTDTEASDHPLSAPWMEKLGGFLERSPARRQKRKAELEAANRDLRGVIRKWERLA